MYPNSYACPDGTPADQNFEGDYTLGLQEESQRRTMWLAGVDSTINRRTHFGDLTPLLVREMPTPNCTMLSPFPQPTTKTGSRRLRITLTLVPVKLACLWVMWSGQLTLTLTTLSMNILERTERRHLKQCSSVTTTAKFTICSRIH